MSNSFDLNDPNLVLDLPDNYDPEADLVGGIPQPPPDGVNKVALILANDTENKEAVRFSKGKIVATFNVKVVKDDGELSNGYGVKDFYPTSQVFNGQTTSALANLCKLAGKPVRATDPAAYISHIRSVFSPEKPFIVSAKTQWVKSTPSLDEEGQQKVNPETGYKEYDELKGQARITDAAIREAQYRAVEAGEDVDEAVANAAKNPHLYLDPLTGDERSVRAEVRYVVGL